MWRPPGCAAAHRAAAGEVGQVRAGQVGAAAEQLGHLRRQRASTFCDALRVATASRDCAELRHRREQRCPRSRAAARRHAALELGRQRRMRGAVGGEARRPLGLARRRQLARVPPRARGRRASRTARAVQPIASRVCAISSAPSGSPCALAVPARPGEPLPMVVRQTISVGRSALRLGLRDAPARPRPRRGRRPGRSRSSRRRENAPACRRGTSLSPRRRCEMPLSS